MNHIIINIGRQFGSGGRQVAMELGRRLGMNTYDNELITKAAEQSGFSKELFVRSDEKRSVFSMSSFFTSGNFNIQHSYINDDDLFKIQSDVIKDTASKESAIFIGRCSDYILRDLDCCIDVFISCPLEIRAKRVAEREGITPEEAEALCIKKDRTRATYYNYFTFGEWGVASNYDLCLDSSVLGIDGTADIIMEFAKKKGLL
ncbi:MAG: cytidylate kinase-like family protein [Bacteroidales bacterium]|jgi:cytidylate kinase|nr:cytidylate kinase-like family protein [Bacteroidales bacterium]